MLVGGDKTLDQVGFGKGLLYEVEPNTGGLMKHENNAFDLLSMARDLALALSLLGFAFLISDEALCGTAGAYKLRDAIMLAVLGLVLAISLSVAQVIISKCVRMYSVLKGFFTTFSIGLIGVSAGIYFFEYLTIACHDDIAAVHMTLQSVATLILAVIYGRPLK